MSYTGAQAIYLHNDWLIRVRLTGYDPVQSVSTPFTGKTITGMLTASAGGAAIHVSLSGTMVEGQQGDYSVELPSAALVAQLTTLVGTIIYERYVSSDGIVDESRPLLVVDQRYGAA